MDWTAIISILLIVSLLVLAIIWRRSKGKRGEKHVAAFLSFLPKKEYKVINDLLLQTGGHSTQIDHVVISVYGIFVIETKYYKGWIYGGENSEYWTQKTSMATRTHSGIRSGRIRVILKPFLDCCPILE